MHNETKTYKINLKPISPIHIGVGEAYEPMNYVIDTDAKDGRDYMYVFDEFEFVKGLNEKSKEEFERIVSNLSADTLFELQKFIKEKSALAKKKSFKKILVSPKVAKEYREKLGKAVQKEGDGKKVINQLIIEKTFISPNFKKAIIPGSSLKGAIATAFGEMLYKTIESYKTKEYFSDFLIADSSAIRSHTFVADAVNIKRNEQSRDNGNDNSIKVRYEVIDSKSEFETTIAIKNAKFDVKELVKACNSHYMPIFISQFSCETDEFTREALSDKFIEKYDNFKLADNQFLLRVGKHSGARAVTVDGIRKIKIINGKGKFSIEEEETTAWLINKQPFGWLLCEILESN
ncbi:RAMP superfamily CRISPR-associated protein [uncultured Campylobacter sp.]|uniref:RAMP superfamily CRISPR-associated protein n=1 Tax=uncultured Campylobacter sp. TaxID=218934 RepID=UPI002638F70A|nr:RAMP superfamily CRISPR-associated protein [uncultured Campylobacter sp.]